MNEERQKMIDDLLVHAKELDKREVDAINIQWQINLATIAGCANLKLIRKRGLC